MATNVSLRSTLGRQLMVLTGALALLLSLSGAALAQESSPIPSLPPAGPDLTVQYVGVTSDPGISVAVVDYGHHVHVYLCDGADLGLWMSGNSTDGSAELTGADGSTGAVTVADGTATGSVTLADGTVLTFSAPVAVLPAGLYERSAVVDGEAVLARTIVLPDGTAKGTSKKYDCAEAGRQYKAIKEIVFNTSGAERDEWFAEGVSLLVTARRAGCSIAA